MRSYRALHARFALTGAVPGSWESALQPLEEPATGPVEGYEVRGSRLTGPGVDASGPAPDVLAALLDRVRAAARGPAHVVVVHAGAVRRGERVLLLPGESGVGKSTLVALLLRSGWSLLSDELLGVSADGRLLPCPLPLRLAPDSCALVGLEPEGSRPKTDVALADLGGTAEREPAAVTDVVALSRGPLGLAPVSRGAAVALLGGSVFAGADPAEALRHLDAATRPARTWRLTSDDPTAAYEALVGRLGP